MNSIKENLLRIMRYLVAMLPPTGPEFIYTTLCRPPWLKKHVNRMLMVLIPDYLSVGPAIIALNKKDPVVSGALALGVYETGELRLLRTKLTPGMTCIDVGAHVGLYTALAAALVQGSGRVFAFEPDRVNFTFLQKTIARNHFHNVTCYRLAITDRNCQGSLYLSRENTGDHRIYDAADGRESAAVQFVTLDHFVETERIQKIDFIKLDIQGAEGLALRGMAHTLRRNPYIKLLTEFWPLGLERMGVSPLAFLTDLQAYGFNIFTINRATGALTLISNLTKLAYSLPGRAYTNLYCEQ